MRRASVLMMVVGLAGCGFSHSKQEPSNNAKTSTEVRENGTPAARKVYVTYDGPERETRRFGRLFDVAVDDFGIAIVSGSQDADARMEVVIAEEVVHATMNGKILHMGFISREKKSFTQSFCEQVGAEENKKFDENEYSADFSKSYAHEIAGELKKNQPDVNKIFVDPIPGNYESLFVEVLKGELAKQHYVLVASATDADAVLHTMGITHESFKLKGINRRTHVRITGSVNYTSDDNRTMYQSIDEPMPEKAISCSDQAKFFIGPGYSHMQDSAWNEAYDAARALAKVKSN